MVSRKIVKQILIWHAQGFNVKEIQQQLQIPEQAIIDIIRNSKDK